MTSAKSEISMIDFIKKFQEKLIGKEEKLLSFKVFQRFHSKQLNSFNKKISMKSSVLIFIQTCQGTGPYEQ